MRKLRVKVLPHLVCFVEGAARDRLVGFEELGNTDGFKLEVLEERLGMSGEWGQERRKKGSQRPGGLAGWLAGSRSSAQEPVLEESMLTSIACSTLTAITGALTPRSRRSVGRPILGFRSAEADDDGDDWD